MAQCCQQREPKLDPGGSGFSWKASAEEWFYLLLREARAQVKAFPLLEPMVFSTSFQASQYPDSLDERAIFTFSARQPGLHLSLHQ